MSGKENWVRDKRGAIGHAAFVLFREVGYRLTSYTMIADQAEVGRPLVQYYFPKKDDLATEFIFRVLSAITELVESTGKMSAAPEGRVVQLGQVYYAFLLSDEDMKRLALDLLSSRQVTSKVVEANAEYTIPLFEADGADVPRLVEASVKATGGVYELMFRGLERALPLDPSSLAVQNVAAYVAFSSKTGYEEAVLRIEPELLDQSLVEELLPKLTEVVFG